MLLPKFLFRFDSRATARSFLAGLAVGVLICGASFQTRAATETSATATVTRPSSVGAAESPSRRLSPRSKPLVTTASLEERFQRTEQADLTAAAISPAKIDQMRALFLEREMANARGERPDLRGLAERQRAILSPDEKTRYLAAQRQRQRADRLRVTSGTVAALPRARIASDGATSSAVTVRRGHAETSSTVATKP